MMSPKEMERNWWGEADRDPVHAEAAEWFVLLRDPNISVEDMQAWQTWMSDARNAQAFARVEEVSSVLADVRDELTRVPGTRWDSYDASVPIRDWQPPSHAPRMMAIAASTAALAVAAVLWSATRDDLPGLLPASETYSTVIGENRQLTLADGSVVTLGGNSSIGVRMQRDARHIELTRGEVFFKVAKDVSRPFTVHAGRATVAAVGTEFNVRRGSENVTVDVVEGRVRVAPASAIVPMTLLRQIWPGLTPVMVNAGEATAVDDKAVESARPISDVSASTSWRSGQLAFRMQPLRFVLEDVNRYTTKPIVLADPALGDLQITGTVAASNVSGWVASLKAALDVVAVEEPDRLVLRAKK